MMEKLVDDAFTEYASNYTLSGTNTERVANMMAEDTLNNHRAEIQEALKEEFRKRFDDYLEMLKGLRVKTD